MDLSILGCSGGLGSERLTTSLLVDDDILLDAGTGVGELTDEALKKIRHVFVSHSHMDHIACLPLLVERQFALGEPPLEIYALPETIEALKTHVFNWTIWPDFSQLPSPDKPSMHYTSVVAGEAYNIAGRLIEPIAVNHVVPGLGFYVESGKGSFCYSGDTSTCDTLWDALNKKLSLDLLVIEVGFANKDIEVAHAALHYCPSLLAADLEKLELNPKIAISHLKPGDEDSTYTELNQFIQNRPIIRLRHGDLFEL